MGAPAARPLRGGGETPFRNLNGGAGPQARPSSGPLVTGDPARPPPGRARGPLGPGTTPRSSEEGTRKAAALPTPV